MSEPEIELARITITRVMTDGDDEVRLKVDGEPRLIEAAGMLQIALHTILSGETGEADD